MNSWANCHYKKCDALEQCLPKLAMENFQVGHGYLIIFTGPPD